MIFLFADKFSVAWLEGAVTRVSDSIEPVFPTISQEQLQREELALLEDGLASVKNMSTDLASHLVNLLTPAMTSALHEEFAPAVASIQLAVDRLVSFSTEKQADNMKTVVGEFMGSMNSALGDQFERLRTLLTEIVDNQSVISEDIGRFSKQLSATASSQTELIDRTHRASESFTSSLEALERVSGDLREIATSFQSVSGELKGSTEAAQEAHENVIALQEDLANGVQLQTAQLDRARTELETAWRQGINTATGAVQQITESAKQVGDGVGDQLVNALSIFDSALAEVIERFSGTLSQLDASVSELPPLMLSAKEQLSGVTAGSRELSTSVERLETLVTERLETYGRDTAAAATQLGLIQFRRRFC